MAILPVAAAKALSPQAAVETPASLAPQNSALFDGSLPHAASAGDDPVVPNEDPAPAKTPRERQLPRRFTSRLARWTGVAALYSVYRDGVLVQRYASRINDHELPPARRAVAARILASLGRTEAIPALGWAQEHDPSPRVRRAALTALIRLGREAEPKLVRALAANPLPGVRQAAAETLSWLVRFDAAPASVEALARAGALDLSEDVRLASISGLSLARSPKALAALESMLVREERPHMRSALELGLVEARRRAGPSLQAYRPPSGDIADTRGPLHAVALKRALVVASLFAAVELAGGFITGNVALKADAIHLASDQLIGLAALVSIWLSRRPPNSRKSYGYLKVESVVGLAGAVMIAFLGFEMGMEAWHRLFAAAPEPATWSVALFALASLAANGLSALILWRHHGESLSLKGAFLHAATDAIGSIGVIVSVAAAILLGWTWVQPAAVALIVALIAKTAWELGKPAWNILIDAVPEGADLDKIEADLLAIPGAAGVHDLHVWALNSTMTALTTTLFVKPGTDHDAALAAAKAVLREKHGISHMTVQIETTADPR